METSLAQLSPTRSSYSLSRESLSTNILAGSNSSRPYQRTTAARWIENYSSSAL